MFRPVPLLVGAALALVALGGYDLLRGDPRAAVVGPAPAAQAAPIALSTARLPLGEVVTSAGATLYRYDQDIADPARSNCAGQCAATWPPVLTSSGTSRLTGIDPALIGIVLRPDGTEQLTLAGWHGTTGGSGAGSVATRPAPKPTLEPAPAPEPDPAPSGGGYGY